MKVTARKAGPVALAAGLVMALLLGPSGPVGAESGGNAYHRTNLVSDQPGVAQVTDPNLVNAWGMAAGPTTPVWVADNGTGKATIYAGDVNGSPLTIVPLVVDIPGGAPTGQVFNPTDGFVVRQGGTSGPARFIFASEVGEITAWKPGVPLPTKAVVVARVRGAVYKGLAIASNARGTFLYAANFHAGRIDVFNSRFKRVHLGGSFTDPNLPDGYAPFGVQELNGLLYVTYAKQDADRQDDVKGKGHGFVDVFDTRGHFVRRLISRDPLNSPWGLVMTPAGFGAFSGDLLVGNFGDGRINAFDPATGAFLGRLRNEDHRGIRIDGLWALRFGNGVTGSPTTLLFTAGPDDESHGLFGAIDPAR